MQPMSTPSISRTGGMHAPPCPTSSYMVNTTFMSFSGTKPASCITCRAVIRQATLALSSIKRDLRKPESVTVVLVSKQM